MGRGTQHLIAVMAACLLTGASCLHWDAERIPEQRATVEGNAIELQSQGDVVVRTTESITPESGPLTWRVRVDKMNGRVVGVGVMSANATYFMSMYYFWGRSAIWHSSPACPMIHNYTEWTIYGCERYTVEVTYEPATQLLTLSIDNKGRAQATLLGSGLQEVHPAVFLSNQNNRPGQRVQMLGIVRGETKQQWLQKKRSSHWVVHTSGQVEALPMWMPSSTDDEIAPTCGGTSLQWDTESIPEARARVDCDVVELQSKGDVLVRTRESITAASGLLTWRVGVENLNGKTIVVGVVSSDNMDFVSLSPMWGRGAGWHGNVSPMKFKYMETIDSNQYFEVELSYEPVTQMLTVSVEGKNFAQAKLLGDKLSEVHPALFLSSNNNDGGQRVRLLGIMRGQTKQLWERDRHKLPASLRVK